MIAIIDYGMGNLKSVVNACIKLGAEVEITSEKEVIKHSKALILPGVGAFGKCIANLKGLKLLDVIKGMIQDNKPYLGICLGMQVLFDESEESPGVSGMGIIKGTVPRFKDAMKVPHMGWNSITKLKDHDIFKGIKSGEHFYFVHSYYCQPEEEDVIVTTTTYGITFASSVQKGNLFACQFHPEKSQAAGLHLLKNFIDLTK